MYPEPPRQACHPKAQTLQQLAREAFKKRPLQANMQLFQTAYEGTSACSLCSRKAFKKRPLQANMQLFQTAYEGTSACSLCLGQCTSASMHLHELLQSPEATASFRAAALPSLFWLLTLACCTYASNRSPLLFQNHSVLLHTISPNYLHT